MAASPPPDPWLDQTELSAHALEVKLDDLESRVHLLPFWYRPIGRWRLARVRRGLDRLRDQQIQALLEYSDLRREIRGE